MAEAPRYLTLRVVKEGNAGGPALLILVDGEELFSEFQGWYPDRLLGEDGPLMPRPEAQRVALYRCSCGEAGCGNASALVATEAEAIVWRDFRSITGLFSTDPTVDEDEERDWRSDPESEGLGTRLPFPELRFAADQYRSEVLRASADRSWETPDQATARLLAEGLSNGLQGWKRPRATARQTGVIVVSLRDDRQRQIVLELQEPTGPPAVRAGAMAAALLASDWEDWNIVFRGGRLAAWDE